MLLTKVVANSLYIPVMVWIDLQGWEVLHHAREGRFTS